MNYFVYSFAHSSKFYYWLRLKKSSTETINFALLSSIFDVTLSYGGKRFESKFILQTAIIPAPQFSQKRQNFYKVEYLSGPYEENSDKFQNILKVILSYAAELSASWQHCFGT
jgi:hypothetical protein